MGVQVNVKSNIDNLARRIPRELRGQIPFATSMALNNTAFAVRQEEIKQVDKKLDRPTPFTKRGFLFKKSSKKNLVASVFINNKGNKDRTKFMKFQVDGGTRTPKKRAVLVYGAAYPKDRYGNIPSSKLRMAIKNKDKFFTGKPKGMPSMPEGIYERTGRNTGIRLLGLYTRSADYTRGRMPFYRIAEMKTKAIFDRNFTKAFNKALRSMR